MKPGDDAFVSERVYQRLYHTLVFLSKQDERYLGAAIRDIAELMEARKEVCLTPGIVQDWWYGHLQVGLLLEELQRDLLDEETQT